ncbi:flagellar export chaperone FliS [Paenibacillus gansuensis]|uniref:Flagellar secretion chaperone FliS n=1 Tax=Paenibacillus gansuensis TaxID=306542 RepID=A0ABW5PMF6_9BACL
MLQHQKITNKYLENAALTATPAQLLIMLYDGAIRFCRSGLEAIENNDYEQTNINLCKAQAIINEFISSLDSSHGVSDGLHKLYEYMNYLLIQGNIKKVKSPIEEVLGYLIELKETWIEASKLIISGKSQAMTHA